MKRNIVILAVFVLALAPRASAQVNAGETSLNLNANLSAGYGDDYTNLSGSDHSIVGAGAAELSGIYHNPNFLSFGVQPFYNQSRLNSSFQSITSSSGVNATATIFSGSDFPGSISYSTTYNGNGNFGIPGLANYTTHGNFDNLAIGWGVHLDDLPIVNFSFSTGNSAYSVYGVNTQGTLHSDTFSVTSAYRIAGFSLDGGYQYSGSRSLTPEFLAGELPQQSDSGANSFFFGVGHNLPWHGSISASAMRLDLHTTFNAPTYSDRYDTTLDTLTGSLSFAPRAHLNVGASTYYTDNLEGTLYNQLVTAGAFVSQNEGQQASHDLSLTGYANYDMPAQHLHFNAFAERQQQTFLGLSFASDSYNGTAAYSNTLLGGQFNGVLGLTRTSIDTTNESMLGLNTMVNYTHQIRRWTLAGGFSYSQDNQTVLIAYTTSGYNYSGGVGRRIGRRSYWGAYASGAKSLLTGEPGSANSSHSYSTSLSLPHFSINGSYSMSSGNALLTSTGLVANPLPLPVTNPAAVVFYNGKSYSVGLGSSPVRGLTLTASYAKALSGTQSNSTSSNNNNENMYFMMVYQFRKMFFQTGYSRLVQGFSLVGTPPALQGSFYVGISRWFNFF
jgi:hypothetical protein